MQEATLLTVPRGRAAVVAGVHADCRISGRLAELGLTPGTRATFLFAAPAGEPRAYLVRGAVIALRNADAGCVAVTRPEDTVWD